MFLFWILLCIDFFFFFKQKTAYEMRISDWSSDVCSSDLVAAALVFVALRDLVALDRPVVGDHELLADPFPGLAMDLMQGEPMGAARGRVEAHGKIGRASCRERVCQYV